MVATIFQKDTLHVMRDFKKVTKMDIESLKSELGRMSLAEIIIIREAFVGLRDDLRMSDMTGYYGDERDRNEQELEEKIRLCEMEYDWRAYDLLNDTVSTEIN